MEFHQSHLCVLHTSIFLLLFSFFDFFFLALSSFFEYTNKDVLIGRTPLASNVITKSIKYS